jgi:hypothetical protein
MMSRSCPAFAHWADGDCQERQGFLCEIQLVCEFAFPYGRQNLYGFILAWVIGVAIAIDDSGIGTIHAVLPQKSKISRKDAGSVTGEQLYNCSQASMLRSS